MKIKSIERKYTLDRVAFEKWLVEFKGVKVPADDSLKNYHIEDEKVMEIVGEYFQYERERWEERKKQQPNYNLQPGVNIIYPSGEENGNMANQPPQVIYVQQKTNGLCIAGFIVSFFISILGLILSAIGVSQAKKNGEGGVGLGIAGIVISIVAMVIALIWLLGSSCFSCGGLFF